MTTAERLIAIEDTAAARAKADANAAIAALAGASFDGVADTAAEKTLKAIVGQRWFDLAVSLGATLVAAYDGARGIRKRYGQALVERGKLARARSEFERLLATPGIPPSEVYEYLGLLGRTYKQQFINTERQEDRVDGDLLCRAIDAYLDGYRRDTAVNTWHGVNAVALLKLAERRGIAHAATANAGAMASDIISALTLAEGCTHWDEATLAEAYVALWQWDNAALQLRKYLWHPKTDPFAVGSTLRQFEEIWELGDFGNPGSALVTMLRARLLEMEDGSVQLKPADVAATLAADAAGHYQKVFGADYFLTLSNYRTGLDRCGPIARIGVNADRGDGTGFLIRGADLDPRLGDEVLLVTNAHVIDPTPDRRSGGLAPDEVLISFQVLKDVDPLRTFKVAGIVWSSVREKLDVTIVRLVDPPVLPEPYPIASQLPLRHARVVAVGHPGGGTLSLSMNDNELIDYEDPGCKVHYRTPTEGGSSGCPIFTKEWKLIAVHHYGGDAVARLNGQPGTYQANEGISIHAIREALMADATLDASAAHRQL